MVNAPEVEQQETKIEENGHHASNGSNGNTKTSASEESATAEINLETATELLNKGKRNLICDNIAQAVTELSQSCAQFDQVFGEGNIKCAKSYFWYGSALLEMARLENGVLGNALQGNATEESASANGATNEKKDSTEAETVEPSDEKDDPKTEENGEKAEEPVEQLEEDTEKDVSQEQKAHEQSDVTENEKEAEKEDETDKENEDEEENKVEGEEENKVEVEELETRGVAQLEESIGGEEDEEDDDDDEDDSLKLSWQMLDWARKLLETATENEVEGRDDLLAQCFLKLGENLMEAAHHPEADVEFQKCIDIYQACFAQLQTNANKSESQNKNANLVERSMAEAYFVAGLNLVNGKNYTNASNHFESAIGVIKKRLSSLQIKLDKLGENEKEKDECKQEMEELTDILPNIVEKLGEAKLCSAQEVVKEANEGSCSGGSALQQAFREVEELEGKANESNSAKNAIESAPANDISHLVKRKSPLKQKANGIEHKDDGTTKRKADSEPDDSISKKQKVDENPDSASNCAA